MAPPAGEKTDGWEDQEEDEGGRLVQAAAQAERVEARAVTTPEALMLLGFVTARIASA
jgi:hypothetical protein